MLTNEQKAVLYALRLIKVSWDSNNDYRGLLCISAIERNGYAQATRLVIDAG